MKQLVVALLLISLVTLQIGIFVGWWARTIRDQLRALLAAYREQRANMQPGVIRPPARRISQGKRDAPINLESEAGGVMRKSPAGVRAMLAAEEDRT